MLFIKLYNLFQHLQSNLLGLVNFLFTPIPWFEYQDFNQFNNLFTLLFSPVCPIICFNVNGLYFSTQSFDSTDFSGMDAIDSDDDASVIYPLS